MTLTEVEVTVKFQAVYHGRVEGKFISSWLHDNISQALIQHEKEAKKVWFSNPMVMIEAKEIGNEPT